MMRISNLLAALILSGSFSAQAATTYTTSFDGTFDETITPPIIGTGSLTLDFAVPDGSWDWLALAADPGFGLTIAFGAVEFTEADLATPAGEVNFEIHGGSFYFSNDGEFGSGPFVGSADFVSPDSDYLTTEPIFPDMGPATPLYFGELSTELIDGTYGIAETSVIPEPSNGIILLGLFLTGAIVRRRK